MLRLRRAWPWLLLVLAIAAIAAIALRSAMGPVVPVQIAQRKPVVHKVVATGRVMPPARVQLGSITLGRATAVNAVEGERVKAGQLLIQIDDAEAKAAVAQAQAGVAQAQARASVVRQVTSKVAIE